MSEVSHNEEEFEKISSGNFQNEDISLDGMFFEKCQFTNCIISLKEGKFKLVGNHFQNCRLSLTGEAANVGALIHLFQKGASQKGK